MVVDVPDEKQLREYIGHELSGWCGLDVETEDGPNGPIVSDTIEHGLEQMAIGWVRLSNLKYLLTTSELKVDSIFVQKVEGVK